jgi:hypothetical protein
MSTSKKTRFLEPSTVYAVNLLVQPLRQRAHCQSLVLATEFEVQPADRTSVGAAIFQFHHIVLTSNRHLHVEAAPHALLDNHAADRAIEVAEDVVQVGTIRIARNERRCCLKPGRSEDSRAAAVTSWTRADLERKSVMQAQ